MLRFCPKCKRDLDETAYNWKVKGVRLAVYCRECSRAYIRDHYEKNQSYYINKAKKRRIILKHEGLEYICEYLKSHPCVDCGETDIMVLEFDHRERKGKSKDLSKMIHIGFRLDKLNAEMSKCEVRCANCHRRKTHRENRSLKFMYSTTKLP